jgi:Zn-dependent M28 family amino/carboxypeptidase
VSVINDGGTDHMPFDGVGLPGFNFIQDEIDYETRTHHTHLDVYEALLAEDLKRAAVVVASVVYHTAMRDAKLPRKPLPQPR